MPTPARQTIPSGDRPFVDPRTGALTPGAYQFLARLASGATTTIQNVDVIGTALDLPPAEIPAQGTVDVVIPASFPPPAPAPPAPNAWPPPAPMLRSADSGPLAPPLPPLDVPTLHNGARLLDGYGTPEGTVPGAIGDLYLQRDGAAGALWIKSTGAGTDTGWKAPGAAAGADGVLPLVNGTTPGPALIADPLGQTIGCPL